jgi:hypothetical protein
MPRYLPSKLLSSSQSDCQYATPKDVVGQAPCDNATNQSNRNEKDIPQFCPKRSVIPLFATPREARLLTVHLAVKFSGGAAAIVT